MMKRTKSVFTSYSVTDLDRARDFYSNTLGLTVEKNGMGLMLHLPGGGVVLLYPKENHKPATFTVLNFEVENIDEAVDSLMKKGIKFERYKGIPADEKGIARGFQANQGPDIAWFEDPDGNIIAVMQSQ
jgi:catechol 2,3-dioxygenase-like lactoylglutathione lyase family enzyme